MFTRHARAAAVRYAAVLFVLYIAGAWVYLARGQLPPVAKLPDHMPKAQLAFVEKIDAHKLLQQKERTASGIRRSEYQDEIRASRKALAADLSNRLRAGDVKDWAFVCTDLDTHVMAVALPDRLEITIEYRGMPEHVRRVVRTLRKGDLVTISIRVAKPDVGVNATAGAFVFGDGVQSIAKVK
jgi:hypothetical protein